VCASSSRDSCRALAGAAGVHFVDFLRATVLLSAAAATALAIVTVLSAASGTQQSAVLLCAGWWAVAAGIGLWAARGGRINESMRRLLGEARFSSALPEYRPGATLLNRLWPLLVFTVMVGALGFIAVQIPGIGAGFAILLALRWRHQDAAVAAIEERDGVRFYVVRTSPLRPIKLARTPGFRTIHPERAGEAAT
jgi:hypothetical protein